MTPLELAGLLTSEELLRLVSKLDPRARLKGNLLYTALTPERIRRLFADAGHDFDKQGIVLSMKDVWWSEP